MMISGERRGGTYTGHETTNGTGGIVFACIELDLARLGLGFGGGLLELLRGLGAQLVGLVLDIIDGRVRGVELGASLPAGGFRGLVIVLACRGKGRGEALLDGVYGDHGG